MFTLLRANNYRVSINIGTRAFSSTPDSSLKNSITLKNFTDGTIKPLTKSKTKSTTHISSPKNDLFSKLKYNVVINHLTFATLKQQYPRALEAYVDWFATFEKLTVILPELTSASTEDDIEKWNYASILQPVLHIFNDLIPMNSTADYCAIHAPQIVTPSSRIDQGLLWYKLPPGDVLKAVESTDTIVSGKWTKDEQSLHIAKTHDWRTSEQLRLIIGVDDKFVDFNISEWEESFKKKDMQLATQGKILQKVVPQVMKYLIDYACSEVCVNDGVNWVRFVADDATMKNLKTWDPVKEPEPKWTFSGNIDFFDRQDAQTVIFCKLFSQAEKVYGQYTSGKGKLGTWGTSNLAARATPKKS
jgi:hypothetical protein